MAEISVHENANFQGRGRRLSVGEHRLVATDPLNDRISSIRVPKGLVALVYEHANEAGGFGISADFLEDCADLAPFNLNDKISYISVFPAEQLSGFQWVRGNVVSGSFVPGHWARTTSGLVASHIPVVAGAIAPREIVQPALPNLLEISKINGSNWTNPPFDTTAPDWSRNIVGGSTFDGSSAHKLEWVSVLNPNQEQDDEVGLAGIALTPEFSDKDLPFTHPFDNDFEFRVVPDSAYEGLLAPGNKDRKGTYQDSFDAAVASRIPVPSGVLGVEVDAAFVAPDYQPTHGERVALYGRWIVDAGHADFHSEIHPPLLMARARTVDATGNLAPRAGNAVTLVNLWSRPYQAGQLFSTNGDTGLALQDYAEKISTTVGDIEAFPPVFPKPFDGTHLVSFTVRPPVPPPHIQATLSRAELQCSYHFTVNGSCGVEITRSPSDQNAVLIIVALNSLNYPQLPDPVLHMRPYEISDLLKQAPPDVNISGVKKAWLKLKGRVLIRVFSPPRGSETQDEVNIVPFTAIDKLPAFAHALDGHQPFPVYGWLKLRWGTRSDPPKVG